MNRRRKSRRKAVEPYLWLLPTLVIMGIFYFYPFIRTTVSSLFIVNKYGQLKSFVGIENYVYLFSDKQFIQSIINTLVFVVISVPFSKIIGLLLAVISDRKRRLSPLYECLFALPMAASASVMALVFKLMYNPSVGLVNQVLGLEISWLNDKRFAMTAIAVVAVWASTGYSYLFLLAAVRGIPAEIMEYCQIEGATFWQKIRYIYLPLVSPTMFFLICTDMAGSVMMMNYVDIMTEGGPMGATQTLLHYMYKQGFSTGNFTNAYPTAVVAFGLSLIAMLISFIFEKKKVNY